MAADEIRRSFPTLGSGAWWGLRRRFRASMPSRVDLNYLQTVLDLKEKAAKNLLPQLRTLGLVGEDGKPTDLANEWRTDEGYATACTTILEEMYPQGLRDAVPPSAPDPSAASRWFMREAGVGEASAKMMARVYVLVTQADPNGESSESGRERRPRQTPAVRAPAERKRASDSPQPPKPKDADDGGKGDGPSLHIDVQIHIPSDATPEQIDAIFASMAKNLYGR